MGNTIEDLMKRVTDNLNSLYGEGRWHCDDLYDGDTLPQCVQHFLAIKRAPASEQIGKENLPLFADYQGTRVRVTMASRFGDVGINTDLKAIFGYTERVYLPQLTNFSNEVEPSEKN